MLFDASDEDLPFVQLLSDAMFKPTFHQLLNVNVIGCLHDPANVQRTSSKCIQNTRELLDVC